MAKRLLTAAHPEWHVVDLAGNVAAHGTFAALDIPIGKNIKLGNVDLDLSTLKAPNEYRLVVSIAGTSIENSWNFWLYPADVATDPPADVLVTSTWVDAQAALARGGKVLFTPLASRAGRHQSAAGQRAGLLESADEPETRRNARPVVRRSTSRFGRLSRPKASAICNGPISFTTCARSTSRKRRRRCGRLFPRSTTGTATTSSLCCSSVALAMAGCWSALPTCNRI